MINFRKKKALGKLRETGRNQKLIVANWKMNPSAYAEASKFLAVLKRANLSKIKDSIIICPPFVYLYSLAASYRGNKIKFGSQNLSHLNNSEATGEISAEMIKNAKAEYVIVGHSERRTLGETSEIISKKIRRALEQKLKVILCVGETHRDLNGHYLRFIENQLAESLSGVTKKDLQNIIIAYEPVWAIGKGHSAIDATDLHQMNLYIKKVMVSLYDRNHGLKTKVLYGGSIDDENAAEIINSGEVDGLLIGRASLNPYVFIKIIKTVGAR